jgi:hypothetical protein
MPNLHTILKDFSIDTTNSFGKEFGEFISQTEQKIKELMLGKEEINMLVKKYLQNVPISGNLSGTECLYANEGALNKLSSNIHSAMLKKLE